MATPVECEVAGWAAAATVGVGVERVRVVARAVVVGTEQARVVVARWVEAVAVVSMHSTLPVDSAADLPTRLHFVRAAVLEQEQLLELDQLRQRPSQDPHKGRAASQSVARGKFRSSSQQPPWHFRGAQF